MAVQEEQRQGRNLALCCAVWSDASTREAEFGQSLHLDPTDHLTIVHVGKGGGKEHWKMGGPLIGDLDSCLESYPHTIVDLAGSIQGNIREFLMKAKIDIVVFGNRYPQSIFKALNPVPVRDWVKQHVGNMYIIIRPEAVRNVRMRFSNNPESSLESVASPGATAYPPPRRIAICYPNFVVGRGLLEIARDKVLQHTDTIDIVHVFPRSDNDNPMKEVMRGTLKLMRAMTLQKSDANVVSELDSINFGAAELEGFSVNLNVVLKGDPKSQLCSYVEAEQIDLLIIGSRSSNVLQNTLTGGSMSSHLIEHAGCPVLVVPYVAMGIADDEEGLGFGMDDASSPSLPLSPSFPTSPAMTSMSRPDVSRQSFQVQQQAVSDVVAALQHQLNERDRIIAVLRGQLAALQLEKSQRDAA